MGSIPIIRSSAQTLKSQRFRGFSLEFQRFARFCLSLFIPVCSLLCTVKPRQICKFICKFFRGNAIKNAPRIPKYARAHMQRRETLLPIASFSAIIASDECFVAEQVLPAGNVHAVCVSVYATDLSMRCTDVPPEVLDVFVRNIR